MQKLNFIDLNETTQIFDEAEVKKICQYLNKKFSTLLKNEKFSLETGFKGTQVQLKLILSNEDKSFYYPIEAICMNEPLPEDEEDEMLTPNDVAYLMLDYLTLYFEEFLTEDRNVFLPLDWSVHQSDEFSFFLRGFVRNLKVEKIADEFLAKHGHGEQSIASISSEY